MQEIEMPKDNDALSLLKSDHEDVKRLFKELEAEEDQEAIFNQIKGALEVHAAIEEEIFYPAVKKARSEEVKEEVREAYEEHKQVKALLAAIAEISPDDESYSAKIKVLKEDVEHHIKEEEGEMFPDARKYLRNKLEDLGAQMHARRDELETNGILESRNELLAKAAVAQAMGSPKKH